MVNMKRRETPKGQERFYMKAYELNPSDSYYEEPRLKSGQNKTIIKMHRDCLMRRFLLIQNIQIHILD